MKFSIVFNNTGDTIPFIAINPDVIKYYVDYLNQNQLNNFQLCDRTFFKNLDSKINKLHNSLNDTNRWLTELFNIQFRTFAFNDYLDQDNLNFLHAEWVKIQSYTCDINKQRGLNNFQGLSEQLHNLYPDDIRHPILGDVVDKLGVSELFNSLNTPLIHGIESSFQHVTYKCSDQWIEFSNPFPKSIVTNDRCNLFLPFNHLGRTQYDKFLNFGSLTDKDDENTFNEFLGFVGLSLARPQQNNYSKEYLSWCNDNRRDPSGVLIPLGNIPNLVTELKKYRIIVLTNASANNSFYINLKG
jgi:hypothetical protein